MFFGLTSPCTRAQLTPASRGTARSSCSARSGWRRRSPRDRVPGGWRGKSRRWRNGAATAAESRGRRMDRRQRLGRPPRRRPESRDRRAAPPSTPDGMRGPDRSIANKPTAGSCARMSRHGLGTARFASMSQPTSLALRETGAFHSCATRRRASAFLTTKLRSPTSTRKISDATPPVERHEPHRLAGPHQSDRSRNYADRRIGRRPATSHWLPGRASPSPASEQIARSTLRCLTLARHERDP